MPTPHAPRQTKKRAASSGRQTPGQDPARNENAALVTPDRRPPTIAFRSFKIALSVFKEKGAIPAKFDRSIWTNKLYSTNLREILEAFRFLGLMDEASTPTKQFAALVSACDTPAWPAELRSLLERSFEPLLATRISTLTAGGLLKVMRTIYRTESEDTRKCCNFFIHAARDAAMDLAPYALNTARSRCTSAGGHDHRHEPATPENASRGIPEVAGEQTIQMLLAMLPSYDTAWPDDIKRYWFGAFHELVLRVRE